MNDRNIPEKGVGIDGRFSVDCGNRNFEIGYVINIRSGADNEMVADTLSHFKHAIRIVASGHDKTKEGTQTRPGYVIDDVHRDSCVSIWTRNSFVPVPDFEAMKIYKVQVNITNEYTSAQALVSQILLAAGLMSQNEDDFAASIIDVSQPQTKPETPVDLAKEFPRDNKPVTTNQGKPAPQQAQDKLPSGVGIIDFDYKQKAMYEAKYVGKPLAVNVSKLRRVINAKKDGTGSYECIEVYGWYNGLPGDRPIYDLRMFAPKEGQQYGDWQTLFKSISDGRLANPGDEWQQPMRLVYKLNQSKKEGDNRVFWNLSGLSVDGDYIPDDDNPLDDYSDAPDWGQDEPPVADEIPWDDGPDNDPGRHLDM